MIFLMALMASWQLALAQDLGEVKPYEVKQIGGEGVSRVEVLTAGGSISVTGVTDPAAMRVEVYISSSQNRKLSHGEIADYLKEYYRYELSVGSGKLTAHVKRKSNVNPGKHGLSVSFRIYAPVNLSTDLTTSGGSIWLTNLSGDLSFVTSGGSLHLDRLGGKVSGTTSGGSIHLQDSKVDKLGLATSGGSIEAKDSEGELELYTSGGSVKLDRLRGRVKAATSGGSVNGSEISGALHASTSGGSVRLDKLSCSLEAATSGGNIDIAIRELTGLVRIGNSGGRVSLSLPKGAGADLDIQGETIHTEGLAGFSGSTEKGTMTGKINGGGQPVSIHAKSCRVSLSFE